MNSSQAVLQAVQTAVGDRRLPDPPVRRALLHTADPLLARRAGRLLGSLEQEVSELPAARILVLGTGTVGPFEPILRAVLAGIGMVPAIDIGPYGAFELTLATGGLAAGMPPDVLVTLLDESFFVPSAWTPAEPKAFESHISQRLADLRELITATTAQLTATVVVHTIPLPAQIRDTFISLRDRAAIGRMWHQLNADLLALAADSTQIVAVDLAGELADVPAVARDERLFRYGDLPYTDAALLVLAQQVRRIVQARAGASKKVLAVDLDNTLWGGVLGEVGAQAVELGGLYPGNCYLELQRTIDRLRDQGVILVLASKNDADAVDEALTAHPEMVLRPAAFSVRAVNWSSKAENLRQAAQSLSLATGSFVFLDDSQFERASVEDELPEVAVVAAGTDPAYLARSLLADGWFDVMTLTDTDRQRPELYRTRVQRSTFSAGFASSQEFLRALDMRVEVARASEFTVGRIAQLAARTNQFNLTGTRFDEAATGAMSTDPGHLVASVSVTDRFGQEGIVGALWVDCAQPAWRVLNLVLSCRVLGRGVELAIAAWLDRQALAAGATCVQGRFIPSARNSLASDFWVRAGYQPGSADGSFLRDLRDGAGPVPGWIDLVEGGDLRT